MVPYLNKSCEEFCRIIDRGGVAAWNQLYHDHKVDGVNLSEGLIGCLNLNDIILDGLDLHRSNLNGACFRRSSLRKVNAKGTLLMDTFFQEADLREADLRGARFEFAVLDCVNFQGALFDETTKFRQAKFIKTDTTALPAAILRDALVDYTGPI